MCTRQSPKGNMRYARSTVPDTVAVETNFFCCFPLALTDICPWPLLSFFQISLKTVKSKPPTIPFRVVACSLSDNLSQHSCKLSRKVSAEGKLPPSRLTTTATTKMSSILVFAQMCFHYTRVKLKKKH